MNLSQEINNSMFNYAKASILLAKEKGFLEEFNKGMLLLSNYYTKITTNNETELELTELIKLLSLSTKNNQHYVFNNFLKQLEVHESVNNFVKLLIESDKLNLLMYLAINWNNFYLDYLGYLKITITSALKLTEDKVKEISELMKKKFANNHYIVYVVNKKILGGLIIEAKDYLYDDSIKNKLDKITVLYKG